MLDKTNVAIVERGKKYIFLSSVRRMFTWYCYCLELPLWYKILPLSGVYSDTRQHFVVAFGLLYPLCLVIEAIAVLSGPCSGQLRGRG